mgnify:CR=1 FL=1
MSKFNIDDPLNLSEMIVGVSPEILEAAKQGNGVPEHDCHRASPEGGCDVCEEASNHFLFVGIRF